MGKERLQFCLEMRQRYPETPNIHKSVVVPKWVVLGRNVTIHEGVTLGSQGFGFEKDQDGIFLHIPHIGKLIIEDDVEIFEGTNVCRGTVGETRIGKGTKIDALCHIGHNVVIGVNVLITAHVIIGGSCTVKDNVYIGLNSTIRNKVKIAEGVFVGQGSNVVRNIVEPRTVWLGNPAKCIGLREDM